MVKIQSILTRARLTTLTISNGFQNDLSLNANQERIKFQLKTNLSCWSKFHLLFRVHMRRTNQSHSQVGFVHHLYKNQHPHEPLPWTLLWIHSVDQVQRLCEYVQHNRHQFYQVFVNFHEA